MKKVDLMLHRVEEKIWNLYWHEGKSVRKEDHRREWSGDPDPASYLNRLFVFRGGLRGFLFDRSDRCGWSGLVGGYSNDHTTYARSG